MGNCCVLVYIILLNHHCYCKRWFIQTYRKLFKKLIHWSLIYSTTKILPLTFLLYLFYHINLLNIFCKLYEKIVFHVSFNSQLFLCLIKTKHSPTARTLKRKINEEIRIQGIFIQIDQSHRNKPKKDYWTHFLCPSNRREYRDSEKVQLRPWPLKGCHIGPHLLVSHP